MYRVTNFVYLAITLCSFCCNLFALVIIGRVYHRDKENISLRILINLISSGLLLSLTAFISTTGILFLDSTDLTLESLYDTYCRTFGYLQNIFYVEIFITLTAISLERWCVVCRPLQAKHVITERKLYVFLLLSWVIAIGINLPLPLYISGVQVIFVTSQNMHVLTCAELLHRDTYLWKFISLTIFVGVFLIPVLIMSVMYGKIIKDLICQSRPGVNSTAPNKFMKQRHRAAKASLLISAQFTLCYGPFAVYAFCLAVGGKAIGDEVLSFVLGSVIPMIGVVLNPILFCYALESFREEIKSVLTCKPFQSTIHRSKENFYSFSKSHLRGTAL